jgi:hypothetical protein
MHKFSGELDGSGSIFRLVPPAAMRDDGPTIPRLKLRRILPQKILAKCLVAVTIFRIRSAGHCAQHAANVGLFAHVSIAASPARSAKQ